MPQLDDGTTAEVANVVWCIGFRPAFQWIHVPIRLEDGWPVHRRGVVAEVPGLYFIGLPFLFTAASALIGGVGRDAAYVADQIARRASDHAVVPNPGTTQRITDSQILR